MSFNQLSLLTIASSMISLWLFLYAWKRRQNPAVFYLSLLLAAVTVWSFFYGLELALTDLLQMKVTTAVSYLGIATAPVFWLLFAATYCGYDRWLRPLNIRLLFIIPAITIVMVASNNLHHLYYTSAELGVAMGYTYSNTAGGPFYWVHVIFSYLAIIFGICLFVLMFFNVPKTNRTHVFTFIAGAVLPFAANFVYVFMLKSDGFFDPTSISLIITCAFWTAGVFTKNLFDFTPLALNILFSKIPDAIIVLDTNGAVISANPSAKALLDSKSLRETADQGQTGDSFSIKDFLSVQDDGGDLEVGDKVYAKNNTPIISARGKGLGTLVAMRDITARKQAEQKLAEYTQELKQLYQAVRNLLNNAGQGFLTFGPDQLVDKEYSAECERIFGEKIDGARVSNLLFPHNEEEQTMVEEIIAQISEEKEDSRREVYLSLLPDEVKLNGSNVQLEFKLLQNSREDDGEREDLLMLILTDITEKRKMEATLQEEKNLFEMIVRVVSNFVDFNATLREYDEFCCNYRQEFAPARDPMHTYTGVMRSIHTFKGLFHQFGMLNMVAKLHALETKLQELQGPGGACPTRDAVLDILDSESMVEWLEEDLLVLKNILGDTYFLQENTLVIDMNSLQEMEQQMLTTLTSPQINLLLPELRKITWKPFRESLKSYHDYIQRLSSQTEKLVYPLELEGGNFKVDPELYRDFVKSLGHVFRNSLDHGIEPPEERVACGKEERGRIYCRVFQDNGSIVLEIGDDGRGISIERIREKALQLQETSQGASCELPGSEEELLQFIFEDEFSTRGSLTKLSGRGVGLAAAKKEVVKLGGKIEVENCPGEGTTLKFLLPQENGSPLKKPSYFEVIGLFLQSARSVLLEQAGVNIQAPSATNLKVADHVRLLDITSIMPLRGVITGKIVLTASRQLCSHMLDHYAMWEVDKAERENCYDDLLTELLNLITGSFLGIFPGGEFVISGLPEKIEAESACLKNSGNELLTYGVELEYGALSFTFVPESDDFLSVAPAELLERFKA